MTLKVPESVRCYYGDLTVRSGVDALLAKPQKLPPDLQWREMSDSYQAWLAAHRVVVHHALALDAVWTLVWHDAVPAAWSPASRDDQVAAGGDTDPQPVSSWAKDWLVRCFSRGKSTLYLATSIGEPGLTLDFGVYNARGSLAVRSVDGFEHEAPRDMLWLAEPARPDAQGDVDLTALHEAPVRAIGAIPESGLSVRRGRECRPEGPSSRCSRPRCSRRCVAGPRGRPFPPSGYTTRCSPRRRGPCRATRSPGAWPRP